MTGTWWRRIAAIGIAASLLTGCAQQAQMDGHDVKGASEVLTTLDQAFPTFMAKQPSAPRLSKNARCYLLAKPDSKPFALTGRAACGPYRKLGTNGNSWSFTSVSLASDGTLEPGRSTTGPDAFQEETLPNNVDFYRPDGKTPVFGEDIPAPTPPRAEAGKLLSVDVADIDNIPGLSAMKSTALWVPGMWCAVKRLNTTSVGSPDKQINAPAGGTLAIIKSDCSGPPSNDSAQPTIEFTDGATRIPLESLSGVSVIALPDDGRDSLLRVTFNQITQTIDASNKRDPGPLAAQYVLGNRRLPDSTSVEFDASKPWRGSCYTTLTNPQAAAYLDTLGIAKPGTIWVTMTAEWPTGMLTCAPPLYEPMTTYLPSSATATIPKLALGGVAPQTNPFTAARTLETKQLVFAIPTDKLPSLAFEITLHWDASKDTSNLGSDPNAPDPMNLDIPGSHTVLHFS